MSASIDQYVDTPLALLAAIWVASVPILTANKLLHEQRDIVLGIRETAHLTTERSYLVKRTALMHSYTPMLIGILVFLLAMSCVIVWTATAKSYGVHAYKLAFVPFLMFCGFAFGGLRDISVMRKVLVEDSKYIVIPEKVPSNRDDAESMCWGARIRQNGFAITNVLVAVLTLLYWIVFLGPGWLRISDSEVYMTFQRSCILPDTFMCVCFLLAAFFKIRHNELTVPFALLGCGAMYFLGLLDISFNFVFKADSGADIFKVLGELGINILCILYASLAGHNAWKNRAQFRG